MKNISLNLILISILGLLASCGKDTSTTAPAGPYQPTPYVQLQHPEWTKKATIYEVNIRQYTTEGTFKAFEAHLPRLKQMGVDILWLMPIHPIGDENRKGSLGSYYSVQDYYGINPDFGTLDDFKALVKKIHESGMYVIIDWVANHSAWDNSLTKTNPEWYTKDPRGNLQSTQWTEWSDAVDFDYDNPKMRRYMTEAMKFWVQETDIDGYRCDVAGFIPVDFWNHVRQELDAIKPVFMLAEWESRDLHQKAFDMTYAWSLYDAMHDVAMGKKNAKAIRHYFEHNTNAFPENAYRMLFVDNHDKNSWDGTVFDQFGDALQAFMVLTCVAEGMPMIYSGQESGVNRSLKFFERDVIQWKAHENGLLYARLFWLKHENQALWNGQWGGRMIPIETDNDDKVLAFMREKGNDRVLAVFNFSDQKVTTTMKGNLYSGDYRDLLTQEPVLFDGDDTFHMEPWKFGILVLH